MIDLHAHILPGVDDGPPDLDASARMAATAVAAGVRVMAATSHVNRGFGLLPPELDAAREEVRERLRADGIPLEVVRGGEISLSRLPDLAEEDIARLTLGASRCVLLECPLSPNAPPMDAAVAWLRDRGYEVLLAHPERSPAHMRDPEPLERLLAMGALAQVTSGSFAGDFGETVRRAAFAMVERGHAHVMSSDSHSAGHRPPDLRPALAAFERRYEDGAEQFNWMADAAPRALLAGERPPERPEPPRARRGGILRRLRSGG